MTARDRADARAGRTPAARGADPSELEMPAPTAWPMVLAFGITLTGAGLVTHASVSGVGIVLALAAALGWWRQVLPAERVEVVPLRAPADRARPIEPRRDGVDRLRAGEGGHRTRVPVEVQPLSAGVVGGLVGGAAMALVALLYGVLVQGSLWYPVNLLSAVAMPSMAQADVAQLRAFSGAALVIGLIAHGLVSMLAGLLYAVILPMLPSRHTLWGGLVAPLLWTGFLWAVLGVINPVLNQRVSWGWFIVSQVAFGVATGFVVARAHPIRTMQTWPLVERAGVQAGRGRPGGERPR